jgi:cytoskeletal protein RodZ
MREIGRRLKEARLALGMEVGDVSVKTRISPHYIRAMEDGKFQIIPRVFDKGYLKIYAGFLGIDTQQILNLFEQIKNPPVEKTPAQRSA